MEADQRIVLQTDRHRIVGDVTLPRSTAAGSPTSSAAASGLHPDRQRQTTPFNGARPDARIRRRRTHTYGSHSVPAGRGPWLSAYRVSRFRGAGTF
jgi:hypothetical protein